MYVSVFLQDKSPAAKFRCLAQFRTAVMWKLKPHQKFKMYACHRLCYGRRFGVFRWKLQEL